MPLLLEQFCIAFFVRVRDGYEPVGKDMNLTVVLEARYVMAADGSVWSQFGMANEFWSRYLAVFDRVFVTARATEVSVPPEGWMRVDGEGVVFRRVPDYQGPWEYLWHYKHIAKAVIGSMAEKGAVILRVPSQLCNIAQRALEEIGKPYALEVVGDPYEVFAPGVVDSCLRPYLRWHFCRCLRKQARCALGVAYVTRESLQRRYPAGLMRVNLSDVELPFDGISERGAWTHYSSVALQDDRLSQGMRRAKVAGPYRIVTVGSLAQLYKGTDVLIDAVGKCIGAGLDVSAVVVGDGRYRKALEERAERLGLGSRVEFLGQLPAGERVRAELDAADLFVLPSRTEGLPRAMIEAMSSGLPCIGTAVGGIPELLEASEMVPVGDAGALSAKIQEVLSDPPRMDKLCSRNLAVAREYSASVLGDRRRRFCEYALSCTERWEAHQSSRR